MKIISLISQKGGAGKTTLSLHIAVSAEMAGLHTVVFDLDPQASAATWGDKRQQHTQTPTVVPVQAARLEVYLEMARSQGADMVIIDSAPNADTASLAAAKFADVVLIPCRPSAFDLEAIKTTLSLALISQTPCHVILNQVPSQGRVGEEARSVLENSGVSVAPPLLHNLIAFSHCLNDGRTVQEFDPKSKAAAEIQHLFKWIQGVME